MNLTSFLNPAVLKAIPVKAILAIPAIIEHVPESVRTMIAGMADDVTLMNIPHEELLGIAVQYAKDRHTLVSPASETPGMDEFDGISSTCSHCGNQGYHDFKHATFIRTDK